MYRYILKLERLYYSKDSMTEFTRYRRKASVFYDYKEAINTYNDILSRYGKAPMIIKLRLKTKVRNIAEEL